MSFTYVAGASDRDNVRLLLRDTSSAAPLFQDEELDAFLALEGGSVRRAAAVAMETTASDQVLVLKVMTILDLKTDGAKVAEALLERAALLRGQATEDEARAGTLFDWAEETPNVFAQRERWWDQRLREGAQ